MSHITLLHLSDLHITENEDPVKRRVREALLSDITEQIRTNDVIIDAICVTGDIVDRGGSDTSFQIAHEFIDTLLLISKVATTNILFTPGNHDIKRIEPYISILNTDCEQALLERKNAEEFWKVLRNRYDRYFQFTRKYNGYNDNNVWGGYCTNIQMSNLNINFISVNTTLTSINDKDYQKLFTCRWQLEDLLTQKNGKPRADITIALMHHSSEWLVNAEKGLFDEFITNEDRLNCQLLLHGHVHTGSIDLSLNPDSSIIKLASGIGYPDISQRKNGQPKSSHCRYSIYRIDTDNKCIDAYLRKTTDTGAFVADTSLYKAGKEDGHITLPYAVNISTVEADDTVSAFDPVPVVSDWVGRNDVFDLVDTSKYKLLAITGIGGQGKSALASEILRRQARSGKTYSRGLWADCRELPFTLHVKIIYLLEAITNGRESATLYQDEKYEDTLKRFATHLTCNRILIIFDNIDAYIKADPISVVEELKLLFDLVINTDHRSMVIVTCRPSISDHRSSFINIHLKGFTLNECNEFFSKRDLNLNGNNDAQYCEAIVKYTNGNPWWLGLIAGQVMSNQTTLKRCADSFKKGQSSEGASIKSYFKSVWSSLKKHTQRLLRYLAEAPFPLTENDIVRTTRLFGPYKIKRELVRLCALGLLEEHEDEYSSSVVYQVHPLIREYVHESFPTTSQQSYVSRILCLFLPPSIVDILFKSGLEIDEHAFSLLPSNLIKSIDTCITSQNFPSAVELLIAFHSILYDKGHHHKFRSLCCIVLDNIDWKDTKVTQSFKGISLISDVVEQLVHLGNPFKAKQYLNNFLLNIESGSIKETAYLCMLSFYYWQTRDFNMAISTINDYEALVKKLNGSKWEPHSIKHLKALALRDIGKIDTALEYFNNEDSKDTSSHFGNLARCYMLKRKYKEAFENIKKSLKILLTEKVYISYVNTGYAYLWISELLLQKKRYKEACAFITLARKIWTEYAPGFLSEVEKIEKCKEIKSITLTSEEIERIHEDFLK